MSDREVKLTRARALITGVTQTLDGWVARLEQAQDPDHTLSDEDRRDIMFTANALGRKATEMVADLDDAFLLTQNVALQDNLTPLMGQKNAAELVAIRDEVFGEVNL